MVSFAIDPEATMAAEVEWTLGGSAWSDYEEAVEDGRVTPARPTYFFLVSWCFFISSSWICAGTLS